VKTDVEPGAQVVSQGSEAVGIDSDGGSDRITNEGTASERLP
jgi:hypothetical protein